MAIGKFSRCAIALVLAVVPLGFFTAPQSSDDSTLDEEQSSFQSPSSHSLDNYSSTEDIHYTSTPILDLLDWEVQSLQKPYNESCRVPPGVDEVCCLGTQSHNGRIKSQRRGLCDHLTLQDYQQLGQSLSGYLEENETCDVCRMVELLRQKQWKFAFFGDSMSNQVEQGLACELQRRNYIVTQQTVDDFEVKHGDGFRNVLEARRRIVRSPLWEDNEFVTLDFWYQYRLPFLFEEERERIASGYDVLVANMGLHWVPSDGSSVHGNRKKSRWNRDKYPQHLADFFRYVHQLGRVKVLAHRETSAMHFDGYGGEYIYAKHRPGFSESTCVQQYDYRGNITGWRERAIQEAAKASNYTWMDTGQPMPPKQENEPSILYSIPFLDFTSKQWAFHPHRAGPGGHLDCTHFCSSPFLFQPIWRGVRLALDREAQ